MSSLSSLFTSLRQATVSLCTQAWQVLTRRRGFIWGLVIALPLVALVALEGRWDLHFAETSPAQKIAGFISKRGDFYNWCIGLMLAFLAWGFFKRQKKWQLLALAMLLSCASAGILSLGVRVLSGRPRPALQVQDGLYGPQFKLHKGNFLFFDYDYQSFPSGHTTTAFATAVPVAIVAPVIGVPLLGASVAVMWSRFQLRRHHLSDLYVGMVFGSIFGAGFGLAVRRRARGAA